MIDLHFHVLPGIDDGPDDFEASLALASAAAAAGTRTIVATPHVSRHFPNDADVIEPLVEELNERLAAEAAAAGAAPAVQIRPGAEIASVKLPEIEPAQLARLGLGGSGCLLVEPPFTSVAEGFEEAVFDLQRRGHRVLIAHPERCAAFQLDRYMIHSLVDAGALVSITAGSLVGRFGGHVQRFALTLVEAGMVHNVASDAHDLSGRPPGALMEIGRAGLDRLADWLTEEVPAAILTDSEIPPRPTGKSSARGRGGRRRWRRPTRL